MGSKKTDLVGPGKERIFLSGAYLLKLENDLFGLFRDLLVEVVDQKTGEPVREKMGERVGPVGLFREARKGEEKEVRLRTYHPEEDRLLELVTVSSLKVSE